MRHPIYLACLITALAAPMTYIGAMERLPSSNADMQAALNQSPQVTALENLLSRYRAIAEKGGWPQFVPGDKKIEPGAIDKRLPTIRAILDVTGDYEGPPSADPTLYDPLLAAVVKRFQERHGLTDDGVIGKSTQVALATPVEKRIAQIEATMLRMRAFPADPGERHLVVNIPEFRLRAFSGGHRVMDMKVIIGKPQHRTPLFSRPLTYVSFNPHWGVPPKIARNEMLPKIVENPDYLTNNNYAVYERTENGREEVDPATIDWSQVDAGHFPYMLRQRPGQDNALGKIKFGLVDSDSIYLHSTSAPILFNKEERALSHGCVRVEHPRELAQFVFKGMENFTPEKVDALYSDDASKIVNVTPLTVHTVYWTAWVEENGQVNFRKDIYGLD
jgi:murein L,D-transpeptidase YcbB/YkuD